jgi:hypothetical protein
MRARSWPGKNRVALLLDFEQVEPRTPALREGHPLAGSTAAHSGASGIPSISTRCLIL